MRLLISLTLWFLIAAEACNLSPSQQCPLARAETTTTTGISPLGPCAFRGTCINGACNCTQGWGDVDCSRPLKPLKLGSVIITQAALDDAPTRYLDIVTDAFNAFRESNVEIAPVQLTSCLHYIAKTPLVPRWNIDFELDYTSVKLQIINNGLQVSAKFLVNIPTVALDVYVSTQPGFGTCCDSHGSAVFGGSGTCTRACSGALGDKFSLTFDMRISAKIYPYINSATQQIEVNVPDSDLVVDFLPIDLGFQLTCNLDQYPLLVASLIQAYVGDWGTLLNVQFTQAFRQTVESYADSFSAMGSGERDVTNATKVKAIATEFNFVAASHMIIVFDGFVRTQRFHAVADSTCPKVYTSFVDTNYDERMFPVPLDFDEFRETAPGSGQVLQTMLAARFTRSAVKAAYWSALLDQDDLVRESTSLNMNITALDATYVGLWNWAKPEISFPITTARNSSVRAANTMRITVANGNFQFQCENTGEVQGYSVYAKTTFDATPMAVGNYTDVFNPQQAAFRFTAQVFDWDTSHFNMNFTIPEPLSVPNALVKEGFRRLLKTRLPVANQLLRENAIPMPPSLARYAPGPRIQAKHDWDNHGADWGNGYLEVTTRCVCGATMPYVSVDTALFGREIIPRCITPCSSISAGRRRLDNVEVLPTTSTLEEPPKQRRKLASNIDSYFDTGKCGPANIDTLRQSISKLLDCATRKDYFSFSRHVGSSQCMLALESNIPLGSCDQRNSPFYRQYSNCHIPMHELYPAVFHRECIPGPYFQCTDTVQQVLSAACTCADGTELSCQEATVAWLVAGAAVALTAVFWFAVFFNLWICRGSKFRTAMFLRVTMRKRDNWIAFLCLVTSIVFFLGVVGWVVQDPIRQFTREIVNSDLFNTSEYVQSEFNAFMVVWSMVALFFMSMVAAQLLFFSCFSLYLGRCIWLYPVAKYEKQRGQWFSPNEYLIGTWRWATYWTMGAIRFQVLALIISLASPPLFYSFRTSVIVAEPQFGWITFDALEENLTSVATAPESLGLLRDLVGYSLMSAAMGFVSSGLIYVLHGAVPGCFVAAQAMIFFINRKETKDRKLYETFGNMLPPPDNSELDRWRRIIYLFIWCCHASGALGSSVAAIILYQALRAPPGWAVSWLCCWVATVPCLLAGTNRALENRPQANVILGVSYGGIFLTLTVVMLYYSPTKAGFSVWLGALLLGAIFLLAFFVFLSEFVNIAQRLSGETQMVDEDAQRVKLRLMKKMGVDVSKSPELLGQDFHWNEQVLRTAGSPNTGLMTMMPSAGNPLFDVERKRVGEGSSSYTAPPPRQHVQQPPLRQQQQPNELDLMRQMTSRSPNLNGSSSNQLHANQMAKAADRLQNKARMSLARPMQPINLPPPATLSMRPEFASLRVPPPTPDRVPPTTPERVNKAAVNNEHNSLAAAAMPSYGSARSLVGQLPATPSSPKLVSQQQQQQQVRTSPQQQPTRALPQQQQPREAIPTGFHDTSRAMNRAQQQEAERMKRRISKRLAARGVKGDAAKELTERIALYHTMKMVNEASMSSAPPNMRKQQEYKQQGVTAMSSHNNSAPSSSARQQQPGNSTRQKQVVDASLPQRTNEKPRFVQEVTYASAQAMDKTGNAAIDDQYWKQFDTANRPAWNGDDSFLSFFKEIGTQITLAVKSLFTPKSPNQLARERKLYEDSAKFTKAERTAHKLQRSAAVMPHQYTGKSYTGYLLNRAWSKLSSMRSLTRAITEVIFETRETMDPATYGLRVPGRRLLFLQGICLMFILLINTRFNRVTVPKLKDQAFRLAFSGMDDEVMIPDGALNWPGVENLTEVLDFPLASYVEQADLAFIIFWIVWGMWVLSFVVEIAYANFGRDMEEKRQGIKYARWLSLMNLPLLLVAVIIPSVPDYVGLSIPGFYKLLPVCAPRFDAFVVSIASDLFGVVAGTYLTFQTLVVLLLVSPAFARALFFVVVREVRELRKVNVFEPRKSTNITRKRLQNARFVWKISPLMSPIITYLPLLLIVQIIGKMYASVLVFVFMGSPVVTALFSTNQNVNEQRVTAWFWYSLIWTGLYATPMAIIMLVEALDRGQVSYLIQITFGNWTFYLKLMCEVALAIVVTSDLLYIFMSSDDELEADVVINEYLDALNQEVENVSTSDESSSRTVGPAVDGRDRNFNLDV